MKFLVGMFVALASFNTYALSNDQIMGFDCTSVTATGTSRLTYESNSDYKVSVTRNWFFNLEYKIHSTGTVWPSLDGYGPFHITLNGGQLAANQYLTFVFSQDPRSYYSVLSGTVFMATHGGTVFSPTLGSVTPLGTFTCTRFEV